MKSTQKAIDQVRDNNKEYYLKLYSFAVEWVKTQMKSFSSEDLKKAYYDLGNEPPFEPRVFGAVFRELSKLKFITRNGYELSKNPICHSRPQSLWISTEYRLKQQKNRLDKSQLQLL